MGMWLSNHAKERMKERGISAAQVRSVIRCAATEFIPSGTPGVTIGKGVVDGRILTVIVGTGTENVITAYWSKAKRMAK
jgi:hypothetical protein